MNTTEITAALLQGSRNIDRMSTEINQLISMIIGFALKPLSRGTEIDETFESTDCKWRFCCKTGPTGYLRIECRTNIIGTSNMGLIYTKDGYHSNQASNIQTVYERLPVFVEGMMKKFSHIEQEWQFLIDASKVKFY